jgi:ABC-2 type transport system permease protein
MVDTRAGFWVLLGIFALTVAALVTAFFAGGADDHTFKNMFILAAAPSAILLPVVGILLVSSEWTQRTTLITFALVPRRAHVVAAKVLAGVALAGVALLIALGLGALGTAIAQPDVNDPWSISPVLFGQVALYVAVSMLMGVGFGALFLSSAPAIVLYFVMPIGLSAIGAIPWFDGLVPWVDWWSSVSILADKPLDATEWARAGTSLAVWMALPLLVGLWRITRSEVS